MPRSSSAVRTLWTGTIAVGDVEIAQAKLIAPGDGPTKVSFNHAHRCTPGVYTRIHQQRVCPNCKSELGRHDVARVFEHAPGQYLEVTDAELARCDAAPSSLLQITHLLTVDPLFIDTTAALVPIGPIAIEPFHTFWCALGKQTALGALVLQKRRQIVTLTTHEHGGVWVCLLRTLEERQAFEAQLESSRMSGVSRANVQAMRALLEQHTSTLFDRSLLMDTYNPAVRGLLVEKVEQQAKASLTTTLKAHASPRVRTRIHTSSRKRAKR